MPKKIKPRTFDEVLSELRSLKFDVREAPGVANGYLVSKYGCAAILGRSRDGKGTELVHKAGVVMGGEIAHLLDRGFQKFFKTSKFEVAATAEKLRAEHNFSEELREVAGEVSLYNEALGSVSDEYMYDRVKGRDKDGPAKGLAPWQTTASAGH
ncbi:hypothetical protein [Silvibacterium acidisoli]|uniref:hypothetical protein n=1 Tax=Acidobacteriaceae bacterium ZG23-2 TaxID=2883246 RepID=UPI00406D38E2